MVICRPFRKIMPSGFLLLSFACPFFSCAANAADGADAAEDVTALIAPADPANAPALKSPEEPTETPAEASPKKPADQLIEQPTEQPTETAPDKVVDLPADLDDAGVVVQRWHFGGGVFYSFANQLNFSNVNANSAGYIYRYKMEAAPVFVAEAKYGGQRKWGFQTGFAADGARAISDFESTGGGTTTRATYSGAGQPRFTFINVYVNAVYRWTSFYIPFGLNLAGVGSSDPPLPLKDLAGSEGVQAGVGWEFGDHLAVETLARLLVVSGKKQNDPTIGTTEVGTGYLYGLQVGVKAYY